MKIKSMMLIVGAMCFAAFLFGAIASTMINAQDESSDTSPLFIPPTFSFEKNLRLGDDNQDVRQLQIILNNDAGTLIADSGIGSKGQESTYFGQLTTNAVMRFQSKNQISATGFVGPLTRNKLNQLIPSLVSTSSPSSVSSLSTSTTSRVSGALPLAKERLPRLYALRPQQIKRGDTLTLVGAGFQTDNTIHVGANAFPHVFPQDGNNISFTIPASAIQNGVYEVWVENSKGTSQTSGQSIKLVVTDSPQPVPVISSVLPAAVSGAEMVTVTGSGFASSGNDVVSGFGTIKNLPSNGSQVTFSPRSLLSAEDIARIDAGKTIKIDFYVVSTNGASNVFGSVNLKL